MDRTITAQFRDSAQAHDAAEALMRSGLRRDQITLDNDGRNGATMTVTAAEGDADATLAMLKQTGATASFHDGGTADRAADRSDIGVGVFKTEGEDSVRLGRASATIAGAALGNAVGQTGATIGGAGGVLAGTMAGEATAAAQDDLPTNADGSGRADTEFDIQQPSDVRKGQVKPS